MSVRFRARPEAIALAVVLVVTGGCDSGQSLETEMMILQLQAHAAELETELEYVYTEVGRISRALNESVENTETAMEDVHRRVLDLPSADLEITMREVEAAVAVANQRVTAVRTAANNLSSMVE